MFTRLNYNRPKLPTQLRPVPKKSWDSRFCFWFFCPSRSHPAARRTNRCISCSLTSPLDRLIVMGDVRGSCVCTFSSSIMNSWTVHSYLSSTSAEAKCVLSAEVWVLVGIGRSGGWKEELSPSRLVVDSFSRRAGCYLVAVEAFVFSWPAKSYPAVAL
jgi:hypothetical protein